MIKKAQQKIEHAKSYIKAYEDIELLKQDIMRPIRMELEVLKPEIYFQRDNVKETVVCFGSARIREEKEARKAVAEAKKALAKKPKDKNLQRQLTALQGRLQLAKYYTQAREFAKLVIKKGKNRFAVVTGGGPGLMEAANRGAFESGGRSIGLNITLPHEQHPNPYISPNMAFLFHYFAIRKLHLVMRAKAIVVFPGGFGTFDELFELLTLVQTGKKHPIPVILIGRDFWHRVVNVKALADYGVISYEDVDNLNIVDTAEEAWKKVASFYKIK